MMERKKYEDFIVFLAPFINSLGGIAIDLYAPSLPSIGAEFSASASMMQNTITITLLFYAIGQLFFGVMADSVGRKTTVIFGLVIFEIGSILAVVSNSIAILLLARAFQGFAIGSCQVVARALLVDNITGKRFVVAITYLSLAFGLGPVISPYIGGLIEVHWGWRYNFVLYAIYGASILALVSLKLQESLSFENRMPIANVIKGFKPIIADKRFMSAVVILGASFSSFLLWNVIGTYIVQEKLGYSAKYFGTTALIVGLAYLLGTLLNRVLINYFESSRLIIVGGVIFLIGIIITLFNQNLMDLKTLLGGIIIIAFSQGLIFSNAMSVSMSLFKERAGSVASLQGCLMIAFGSIVTHLVSSIKIENGSTVASIFLGLFLCYVLGVSYLKAKYYK
ncbi:MFS transporter [Moraxella atlantae]|uniref:Bcr/CflA family efflux transporter n=1 Tax=Faucicola atlantae TaxID=34059 RepID=A0A1B8Q9C0_9GAMM|nr:multidrug effflux MFS transporter [Moraxella atlantae]OBX75340.1 MFS transporter [Moraxella atlantae]